MSAVGEMRHGVVEALEGFISDDGDRIKTPSMGDDSIFDYLPFENIATPLDNVSSTCTPRDVALSDILGSNKSDTSDDDDFVDIGDVQDICPACTTPYCQAVDSLPFKSSLRLTYNDAETHTWFIGSKYIMAEAMDDESSDETDVNLVLATDLLRGSTRVPVPNVIAGWKENGKIITITEQAPGQRLYDIWWDLKNDEREGIAREVSHHVDRWRRITADRISSLGGGSVWHHDHLFGTEREGFGPFESDEQMWSAIRRRLKRKNVDKDVIQTLKDYMPESAPVLTHGDLSCANILIHRGTVSAILGFGNAACLPVWAEHVAVHFCYTKEDEQWKKMLSKHIKSYPWAKDWWSLWTAAEKRGSDRKRIALLVERCRRWQKPPEKRRLPYYIASDGERAHKDPSRLVRDPEPEPRRDGVQVRKKRIPFRIALSKKLLRGRHYSELLRDPHWELVLRSPTEESDVGEVNEGALASIEERMDVEKNKSQNLEVPGERPKGGMHEDRRISIERWLSESERGRKALRPLITQHVAGDTAATPPNPSPTKSPPWRARQRSFERPDNSSKGLRPFSLPLAQLSDDVRQNLKEIGQDRDRSDDDDGGKTHEQLRDEALRSLETGWEDAPVATTSARWSDNERTEQRLSTEGKRTSIFRERTTPGSLYLAVANVGAEGKTRRHRRSRSEERASMADKDEEATSSQQRPRPRSFMPQFSEG
ncbi:hypothetical protein F5Y13DRAFT_199762 [Hypoxylon sp. FL1857]|nr:hypothetical protein F5Y13DRAFT_199762 [Hypoxylon sp. FL1857]